MLKLNNNPFINSNYKLNYLLIITENILSLT